MISLSKNPVIHDLIISGRLMSDINQQKNCFQLFRLVQIILNHFSPFRLDFYVSVGIAITRKVYHIKAVVQQEIVDELCLARLFADFCELAVVRQHIDEGRFPDIRFPDERKLRHTVIEIILFIFDAADKNRFFDLHFLLRKYDFRNLCIFGNGNEPDLFFNFLGHFLRIASVRFGDDDRRDPCTKCC